MSELNEPIEIPGEHPLRTTPIGQSRPPTDAELQLIRDNLQTVSGQVPLAPPQFQFHAAFDGTWNEAGNLSLSGNVADTSVAQISNLIQWQGNPNVASNYVPGVGTSGLVSQYVAGSILPTGEVFGQASNMYQALIRQAGVWSQDNPGVPLDISITAMAFSRGNPAMMVFGNMVNQGGIPDPSSRYTVDVPGPGETWVQETRYSRYFVEPGAQTIHGIALEPVGAGVFGGGMADKPPNMTLDVVYADDEHRRSFGPMLFSDPNNPDPNVRVWYFPGSHTDIGFGYDTNGIGASVMQFAHTLLRNEGTLIPDIPEDRTYDEGTASVHDSAVGLFQSDWVPQRPQHAFWRGSEPQVPDGATIHGPHWAGDNLTIYYENGGVETINTQSGEITSITLDADGNTHQVVSRLDGETGRIYIERTFDAGTGEEISSSAVRVDTITGEVTVIDPVSLSPETSQGPDAQLESAVGGGDIGTPPTPGPGVVIADSGNGVMTDAGPINGYGDLEHSTSPPLQPDPPREAAGGSIGLDELGAQLSEAQAQQLHQALATLGLDAQAMAAVSVYTNADGSRILANAEGEIIGTVQPLGQAEGQTDNGWLQVRLNGQGEPVYLGPQGQAWSEHRYNEASAQDAAGAMNLVGSLAGLQNWSQLNAAQQLSALAGIYNQIDNLGVTLGGGNLLPGDIGDQAGALSGALALVNGIENDNALQAFTGGVQLGNAVGAMLGNGQAVVSDAIGSAIGVNAGQVVPILNLVIALDNIEENPLGAVAAAASFIPVYGQVIAAFVTVFSMFMDNDIPPSIGEAEVQIDASGAVVVNTTQDEHGGGGTAAAWAQQLAQVALSVGMSAPQAGAPAQHLPSVGYYHDPDGANLEHSQGHLILRWTDENGVQQQRVYDSHGMRWDGNSVEGQSDIMRDYLLLMESQQKWPPVMYQEVTGGVLRLDYGVATVLYATALGTYDGMAEHTQGGDEAAEQGGHALIEVGHSHLLSLGDATVDSGGQPVRQVMEDGQIQSVPPAMGAHPQGPQPPLGRNPIVFVPAQAMTGTTSQTVTAGMVTSLNQAQLLHEGQMAATAMALGLTGMAFASHAGPAGGAGGGTGTAPSGAAQATGAEALWGPFGVGDSVQSPSTESGAATPVGVWTDADGRAVAPAGTRFGGDNLAADAATEQVLDAASADFISDGMAPGADAPASGAWRAAVLPEGFSSSEADGAAPLAGAGAADLTLDHPSVSSDRLDGTEDEVLRFSAAQLLANDSTPNPAPMGRSGAYLDGLRIVEVGPASAGQVGIRDGQLVYVPDADFHGEVTFTYTVQDMYGMTQTGTVSIWVAPVNDTPVARGESATLLEDTDLVFTAGALLRNDSDVDGDRLRISRVGEATGGTVLLQPDGSVRFVPTPDYNGPAGYTYWVSDGQSESPAQVRLNVLQVNDLPVVQGEYVESDEDVVLNFPFGVLLANDSDVDTDPALNLNGVQTLTISAVGNAQHGTVAIIDGQVRFTPEPNHFGPASFDYLVDDGEGGQVSTTVVMNLAPVNDAPDVQGENDAIAEDTARLYTQAELLANDSDVDNTHGELFISAVGGAVNGSVELLPDGRIRFVPDADYFGPASFDYLVDDGVGGQSLATVTLEVTPVNDDPRLQGERIELDEDTVAVMTATQVLANDHDVDNDHADLALSWVGDAVNGTVSLDADGQISFTPTAHFYGAASFSYTVTDGVGGSSNATVVLDYRSVNDLPVVNNELFVGKRDMVYTFTQGALLANDTDVEHPSGLQIVAVGGAVNGSVSLLPDGSVRFEPAGNYAGWDPATYGVFEYTVRDPDGGESTGTTFIDYSRVNLNPVVVNDHFQGYEDVRMEINVSQLLRNDRDPDPTPLSSLSVVEVGDARHGTVSLNNGVVSFNPSRDFYGEASFRYRVSDGEGGSTWGTAFIDIERENRAPVITGIDLFTGNDATLYEWTFPHWDTGGDPTYAGGRLVDDPHRVQGRIYAHDPDGDALTFTINSFNQPQQGVAFIGQVVDLSAPAGLDHMQLQGRADTAALGSSWAGSGTIGVPGVDPDMPNGGRENYFVNDFRGTGAAYAGWQYISMRGNTYSGVDYFSITVTDSRGLSTTSDPIQATHVPWRSGGGGCLPVVVDTGSDGIDLLRPDESDLFADISGDGWREQIGWVASTDALLAYDANGDGLINQRGEISFVGYQPGARTDLEGLAAFDSNGDGVLSAADEQWQRLGLLQDANGNRVQDEGEFQTLESLGIAEVSLTREGQAHMNNGNVVFGTTTLTREDGTTLTAADVMFAGEDVPLPNWVQDALAVGAVPATAGGADAEREDTIAGDDAIAGTQDAGTQELASAPLVPTIEQQADAFVQMVTTQMVPTEPLAFVDMQDVSLSSGAVAVADSGADTRIEVSPTTTVTPADEALAVPA